MKQAVILDFNRTLYDPDANTTVSGAQELLQVLHKNWLLFIISHAEAKNPNTILNSETVSWFREIVVAQNKNLADFASLIARHKLNTKTTYIIGDRIQKEIMFGNTLGCKTIWIQQGKFANELPTNQAEQPTFTVTNLKEIPNILSH